MMHTANLGDCVQIQYRRMPTNIQKTCEFTVGSSEVFRSLSLGIVGMAPGDRKQLTLQPQEAYGKVKTKLIRRIPRERFPQHVVLRVGKRLAAVEAGTGRRRRVRVVKISPDSVLVDGNHPLAGKIVELEVCLVSIDSSLAAKRLKPQQGRGKK